MIRCNSEADSKVWMEESVSMKILLDETQALEFSNSGAYFIEKMDSPEISGEFFCAEHLMNQAQRAQRNLVRAISEHCSSLERVLVRG